MDRSKFYASLRQRNSGVFGTSLSQRKVEGTDAILDAAAGLSVPHAAHVLAEAYHETGGGMYPVKETVFAHSKDKNPTDAQVIARLDAAFAKGQLTWVSSPYWRGGMFGRGQIQITHSDNYLKLSKVVGVDLFASPDRALELPISAKIAVQGCARGLFTGKKLSDFDGIEYDHYNARAIVNGDKRANGAKIAGYGEAFEAALKAGGWGTQPAFIDHTPPKTTQSPLAALFAAIAAIFGGKS